MGQQIKCQFRQVSKSFNNNSLIKRLSFSLTSGDVMVVTGPSGSGKSTVLFLAAQLLSPDGGTIAINNRQQGGEQLRKSEISFMSSTSLLLPCLSVEENLQLASAFNGEERTEEIKPLLASLGLKNQEGKYPHQLSTGQRQRVSLLMALAKKPSLLLLDEPTSALDEVATGQFCQLLKDHCENCVIIMTTHRRELIGQGNLHIDTSDWIVRGESGAGKEMAPARKPRIPFLHYFRIGFRRLLSFPQHLIILVLALTLALPTFYCGLRLGGRLEALASYQVPGATTWHLGELSQAQLIGLQEKGYQPRRSFKDIVESYFPPATLALPLEDSRLIDVGDILVSRELLLKDNLKIGEVVKKSARLLETGGYHLLPEMELLPRAVIALPVATNTQVVYYRHSLFEAVFKDEPVSKKLSYEIESQEALGADLKALGITWSVPFSEFGELIGGVREGFGMIFWVLALLALCGLVMIIGLILAILKIRRDPDLVKLFSLGGTVTDIQAFLLAETIVKVTTSALVALPLIFLVLSLLNKWCSQILNVDQLFPVDILGVGGLTFGYLLVALAIVSLLLVGNKKYKDVKGSL